MGIFSSYLSSILTVGIFSFICEAISGISGSSNLKKVLSFITSLCLFIVIALPLLNALKGVSLKIEGINEESGTYTNDAFFEQVKFQLENEIHQNIYTTFGINPASVRIDLSVSESSIEISKVEAEIPTESISFNNAIIDHLKSICGKGTEVIISENEDERPT